MASLDTASEGALYNSLAEIFSAPRHLIEYAIIRNNLSLQSAGSAEEVNLKSIKRLSMIK